MPSLSTGSAAATGSGSGSGSGAGSGPATQNPGNSRLSSPLRLVRSGGGSACGGSACSRPTEAVKVTVVPQPDGSSETVPVARSPSQATVCSGSTRGILISPSSPRCRASASTSLSSPHSSGGDLTRVRLAVRSLIAVEFERRGATPASDGALEELPLLATDREAVSAGPAPAGEAAGAGLAGERPDPQRLAVGECP